jgi:hypothetical protein
MITKLTQKQIDKFPYYVDKWIKTGLSTDPINKDNLRKDINKLYICGRIKPPKFIILLNSPISCLFSFCWFNHFTQVGDQVGDQVWDKVGDQVGAQVWAQVRDQVWDKVWDKVGAQVRDQVWDKVWDKVGDQVGAQVWAQVWDQVRDKVRDKVGAQIRDKVWDKVGDQVGAFIYGQHDSSWLAFYEYFYNETKIQDLSLLSGLWNCSKYGWILPYKHVCFVSERHNICNLKNKLLHCDGGPAIQYPDGWSVWALNGVGVSQEISETPANKLNAQLILSEKNAEVRREIVRKIGVERIVQQLGATTINKMGTYELLQLNIPNINKPAKYLKMLNPSIGVWHLEGVPSEIETCQEAINWRAGDININWNPSQLT